MSQYISFTLFSLLTLPSHFIAGYCGLFFLL